MISSRFYRTLVRNEKGKSGMNRIKRRIFHTLRSLTLRICDPDCEMQIHGTSLRMPLSHPLPLFLARHPQYDSVLSRMATYLRQQHDHVASVDVGANIGDTLAAMHPEDGDWALAVEPFAKYRHFLQSNATRFESTVEIVTKACVDTPRHSKVVIDGFNGTGVMKQSNIGTIETTTLDELALEYARLSEVLFLKVDVDGHDFSVIRGGMKFIEKVKPIIFMESDIFDNSGYADDVLTLCHALERVGYQHLIIYDHQGGLIHATELSKISTILSLLYYQSSRGTLFFDLMFGTDLKEFFDSELQFFNATAATKTRGAASAIAATRWQEISPLGQ